MSRKNEALLAILALDPGRRQARERLIDLLWGEGDSDRGRNSLRQALTGLRRDLAALDPAPIAIGGETLALVPDAVAVDVVSFERLAASESAESLRRAAALYRGDLLAGFGLRQSAFDDWLNGERTRLHDRAVDVLMRLATLVDGQEAVAAAERLVTLDPLRDLSQQLLMERLAAEGNAALALQRYRQYCALLDRELGLQPSETLRALQQAIAAGTHRRSVPREAATIGRPDKPTVVVMPFENRSLDRANQQFCATLAGQIADALSRVASFAVIPWRQAAGDLAGDAVHSGAALGACYVLQGGVLLRGARLRISARIADTATGLHVWSDQYDCTDGDLLDAQDMIVKAIAASAETQVMLAARSRIPRAAPDELAVKDLIALGTSLLYDETPTSLDEALVLAERAIAREPRDARAHALLAHAFVQRVAARAVAFDPALVARGVDLARAAVGMASDDEWTHLTLARILIEAGALDDAIAEAERALTINPSSVTAVVRLSECFALLGRAQGAIEASQQALRLDPRSPEAYQRHFTMALAHFSAGDDEAALDEAGRAARWQPGYARAHLLRAAAAAALGRMDDAAEAVTRCCARYPGLGADDAVPRIMPPFARPGDRDRLIAMLRRAGMDQGAARQ